MRVGVPAKIVRPDGNGALGRERLFERLDRARSRPVVWVSGPAGSGKTTLVSSYVEARGLQCLWYQVDSGDEDLASFFYYLGLAGKSARARTRNRPPLFTPDYHLGIPAFSRNFFEALSHRLTPPALIILDDIHSVSDTSALHAALLDGLTRFTPGVTLLALGRTVPPPAFARLRATGRMEFIGWDDLRLTPEEMDSIVEQGGLAHAGAEILDAYRDKLDGWAVGLRLVLEAVRTDGCHPKGPLGGPPEEIFDFFGGEVFNCQDAETKEFLLKSSFLPSMTAAMAQGLTADPSADRRLAHVHRHNCFTERLGRSPPTYRYHALFREFLMDRAKATYGPEEISRLERAAARTLAEAGQPEEAAGLLASAGDWDVLAKLILDHAPDWASQGRIGVLEAWLRKLPEQARRQNPWLVYWLGVCGLTSSPAKSLNRFESAFHKFRSGRDSSGVYLAWCGAVEAISYDWAGSRRRWDRWVALLDEILTEFPEFPTPRIECAVARCITHALAWRMPTHPKREFWRDRLLALAAEGEDPTFLVQSLVRVAGSEIMPGSRLEAASAIRAIQGALRSSRVSPPARISAKLVEGIYQLISGRLDEARDCCESGLEEARSTGVHLWDALFLLTRGFVSLSAGDREGAARAVAEIASHPAVQAGFGAAHYYQVAAWEAMLGGEHAKALSLCRKAEESGSKTGIPLFEAWARKTAAQAQFALRNRREAWKAATEALRRSREISSPWLEWGCLMDQANFLRIEGREEEAASAVREAFTLGSLQVYRNATGLMAEDLSALCALALSSGIEVGYARELIRTRGLLPSPRAQELEAWPFALKIYTLGRFEVVRDGAPIRWHGRPQQKPLTLLRALLALGGRKVGEADLRDLLWPDATGDLQHRSFETTLYRLRQLLGLPEALDLTDGRLTLDPRYCWVDRWAFERRMGQFEAAFDRSPDRKGASPGAAATVSALGREALALYSGPFLSGEDGSWAVLPRERLRNRYLRGIEKIGNALERAGDEAGAGDWYGKGLDADPLAEELCQRLMTCYQRLGRRAEALAAYARHKQVLAQVLGITPSPQTDALARKVRDRP